MDFTPDAELDVTSTLSEIRDLRRRLAELEARIGSTEDGGDQAASSRRHMLKLAGATAVGAVAATVVGARMAAADEGIQLVGAPDTTPIAVRHNYTGTAQNVSGVVFQSGTTYASNEDTISNAAVAGWATPNGTCRDGVYGYSGVANGFGVFGYSSSAGIGGRGFVGGSFTGQVAALKLPTGTNINPNLNPSNATLGMVQPDQLGNVWLCIAAGNPGVWRQIGGPGFAGAFHAITPARVYDSRSAVPLPGALAAGANRTVSVADARDLTTGAVTTADIVPAGATAVFANVTIANTTGAGYLAINPGGTTTVAASSINWSGNGQDLANGLTLTLNASRQLSVIAGGGGSTDFVIDISGYYL